MSISRLRWQGGELNLKSKLTLFDSYESNECYSVPWVLVDYWVLFEYRFVFQEKTRKNLGILQYGLPQQAGRIANDELVEMFCVYL
jgi:hypothetical protein